MANFFGQLEVDEVVAGATMDHVELIGFADLAEAQSVLTTELVTQEAVLVGLDEDGLGQYAGGHLQTLNKSLRKLQFVEVNNPKKEKQNKSK